MSSQQLQSSEQFFDATKFSESALRKYQSYFKLDCKDQELREKVKNHFENDFKIDCIAVVERFLKLKRDEKDNTRKSNRPRGGKPNVG